MQRKLFFQIVSTFDNFTFLSLHRKAGQLNKSSSLAQAQLKLSSSIAQAQLKLSSSLAQAQLELSSSLAQAQLKLRSSLDQAQLKLSSSLAQAQLKLSSSLVGCDQTGPSMIPHPLVAIGKQYCRRILKFTWWIQQKIYVSKYIIFPEPTLVWNTFRVGSWPDPETLDQPRKACQEKTLLIIFPFISYIENKVL